MEKLKDMLVLPGHYEEASNISERLLEILAARAIESELEPDEPDIA